MRGLILALAWLAAGSAAAVDPLPQVASGRIERIESLASAHVPARHVDVWLPDGYPADAPYALLLLHDGQMLFDAQTTWNRQEWRIDEVAAELIARGETRPFIAVGVWNAGERRGAEYFPQRALDLLNPADRERVRRPSWDGQAAQIGAEPQADAYLAFLVQELLPLIESRYAVSRAREDRVLMGSSMGGLISLYALAEQPEVFGAAACLSTHWPGSNPRPDSPLPEALIGYVERHLPPPGRHRLYFDLGTITLDAYYPPHQARVDAVLAAKGYGPSDWITHVYPAAEHSEIAWARRVHVPLRFLLPPRR